MGSKRGSEQQQQAPAQEPTMPAIDMGASFNRMMDQQAQNRMAQIEQRLGRVQQFGQALGGQIPWHQFAQQLGGQGGFLGLLAQFQGNQQQLAAQQAEIEKLKKGGGADFPLLPWQEHTGTG